MASKLRDQTPNHADVSEGRVVFINQLDLKLKIKGYSVELVLR